VLFAEFPSKPVVPTKLQKRGFRFRNVTVRHITVHAFTFRHITVRDIKVFRHITVRTFFNSGI